MIDKVKMWVLIHCYRVLMDRMYDLQVNRNESNLRRYRITEQVYSQHYFRATSWERHALYEYAEGGDQ